MNIPGFEIISKIEEDSIFSTWQARQVSLNRIVQIKVVNNSLKSHPETLQMLLNEARTASQLKTPNIVLIYDIGKSDGAYYFVTEHVEGQTVAHRINNNGRIPTKEALIIASALSAVLEYIQQSTCIIHRNISPQKILIDSAGVIKIADLGLTAATGMSDEAVNYFSPEQISGGQLSIASDMYSLGCTLYHMITGKIPFEDYDDEELSNLHMTGMLKNPRKIDPSIPLGVVQLLERLTMKNPSDRYSSWKEVSDEISKVSAGRILLQKNGSAGPSTIPAQSANTSTKTGATPAYQPGYRADRRKTKSVPLYIQLPAWTLLFVWWIVLGYIRYPDAPPTIKHYKVVTSSSTTTTTIPTRTSKKDDRKPETKNIRSIIKTDEEIIAEAEANKTREAKNPEYDKLSIFMKSLMYMIYQYDFKTASDTVKNELAYMQPPDVEYKLRGLANLLDKLEPPMKLVEEGFSKKKGMTTSVVYNGVSRTVKIKAVSNQKVVVTMPDSDTPITFELKNLDPAECGRWIPSSTSPEVNAVRHILYMKASDYENAAKYAKMSGILSDFFMKEVKNRQEQQASLENSDNL